MGNRAAFLVLAAAGAMLAASFGLHSEAAYAESSPSDAINEIGAIQDEAWDGIDATVAAAAAELEDATTVDQAKAIRDLAEAAVDGAFDQAIHDMSHVVAAADDHPDVEAAFDAAKDALDEHAAGAEGDIKALYDDWKFEHEAPPAAEVISKIDEKLTDGLERLDGILERYQDDLAQAKVVEEADADRDKALEDIADRYARVADDIDDALSERPFDPEVVQAHSSAVSRLDSAAAVADHSIRAMHEAWPAGTTTSTTVPRPPATRPTRPVPPPPTTPFTRPPTTGPTTTTSTPTSSTTTTTLNQAAQLPSTGPSEPGGPAAAPDPAPAVLSDTAARSVADPGDGTMAAVGFVRRIVDSQLPTGVATVAAGPLVVLGLVIDAIRAAGAVMLVPWLLLGVYMAGLLSARSSRKSTTSQPGRLHG